MNYDSKNYVFQLTVQEAASKEVKTPDAEGRWVFVSMVPSGADVVILWAKPKTGH